jgi:uncharacterized membrane protein HdeD (DUF308 family)
MAIRDSLAPDPDVMMAEARSSTSLQRRWTGLLLLGIVQLIGGLFALAIPTVASFAAVIVFGAVLLAAGVFQAVQAFSVIGWKGRTMQALGALVYIVAGILALIFPMSGALTLTIVVAATLIADGAIRSMLAYRLRPAVGWGWFLAAGIASTFVGILLLIGWPLTGLWAIGVLLGVSLVFSGVTNCALAITLRARHVREPEHEKVDAAHRHA